MKKDMNYITTLPDFIEMQRLSFSWFISQGLSEELSHFSSILDFSNNILYSNIVLNRHYCQHSSSSQQTILWHT